MTIAEDFKKWMGEKASQVADYAGDYPGRVEEQFRSGLSSMQQERQAGLPGHLGALQARYSLSTPFVMDALSQAGKGLSKLGQQQQLGIDEAMSRIGVDVPERKEVEPMGVGIPAVLWGILRGKRPTKAGAARRTGVPWKFAKKDADFYVMKKGQNAGQIVKEPGPNTIGIVVDRDVLVPKYAEYMFQNIHNQGGFKARQQGSVIPFITNDDIDDVVLEWMSDMSRRR